MRVISDRHAPDARRQTGFNSSSTEARSGMDRLARGAVRKGGGRPPHETRTQKKDTKRCAPQAGAQHLQRRGCGALSSSSARADVSRFGQASSRRGAQRPSPPATRVYLRARAEKSHHAMSATACSAAAAALRSRSARGPQRARLRPAEWAIEARGVVNKGGGRPAYEARTQKNNITRCAPGPPAKGMQREGSAKIGGRSGHADGLWYERTSSRRGAHGWSPPARLTRRARRTRTARDVRHGL